MKEKCDAACLKVGDNTIFGKIERISVGDQTTILWLDDGSIQEFNNDAEITFWE